MKYFILHVVVEIWKFDQWVRVNFLSGSQGMSEGLVLPKDGIDTVVRYPRGGSEVLHLETDQQSLGHERDCLILQSS